MSGQTWGFRAIVLATIALCITATLKGAQGAEGQDKGSVLRVATIDKSRLLSEYKFTIKSDADLRKEENDVVAALQTWKQNPLLTEADQKALGELVIAEANTPAGLTAPQKMQKQKLMDASKAALEDQVALSQKKVGEITALDQEKINRYARAASETDLRIQTRQADAQKNLQTKLNENTTKVLKDVREGVAKIAKEKGFHLVLSNDVAWYADADLTDAVLAQINK